MFRALLLILFIPCVAFAQTYHGKVVAIADGDTLTILVDQEQIKIRLSEIDAPEKGQPFGTQAKQALSALVFSKFVDVDVITNDRYGRSVGRVYVNDLNVNAELVRQGHAWVYRKYAKDQLLYGLEGTARSAIGVPRLMDVAMFYIAPKLVNAAIIFMAPKTSEKVSALLSFTFILLFGGRMLMISYAASWA